MGEGDGRAPLMQTPFDNDSIRIDIEKVFREASRLTLRFTEKTTRQERSGNEE